MQKLIERNAVQYSVLRNYVKIPSVGMDRSQQTVLTQIRLLPKKQSDQGHHYLPFACITAFKAENHVTYIRYFIPVFIQNRQENCSSFS